VTESRYWDERFDDVEAMVRAAGEYVRASDDLRPRVLEAVRQQYGEQRARRRIKHVAAFVLPLAIFTGAQWRELDDERLRPSNGLLAAAIHEVVSSAPVATARGDDGDWRMIDAFTKLRRQQAQVLRFEI